MDQKIVIVCGGRSYNDRATVYKVLNELRPDVLVHGACGVDADMQDWPHMRGVDAKADDWAIERGKAFQRRPAAWKRLGNKAGPIRNRQMAEEFPTATVIAFPGGDGTASMISIAREAGMTVRLVTVDGVLL